ncbi:RNA polymerase recycling motor HelD [Bacillus ndiopicus]|uniref:RNA polymerase recycling motor HelD n=1 Tax=Bacillus ndiopicus TaxID=1347368 RepID=UPI0005A886B4|nr:RNA polymerase recycling motor HelD [Bacillus ndiopicus]
MNLQFQQEQKRVNDVMDTIVSQINRLEEETSQRKNDVMNIRKHFWEEVKVNTDTFDDFLETIISLRQEAQALSVSQSTHQHAAKRLSVLQRMKRTPYFGRIDFKEQEIPATEQLYIGISSLMDESGEDFLIYDWRAPISSVYYDYQPGPAHYVTPEGIIHGDLEKKWQYLIREGVLQSMFDTSLTIGDEILQQALGKGTDKYMHSIVATIQQEQNRIIRYDQGRLLVVHGAAGSGKTSAALQRVAYLLYKYRDSLDAEQIILFSPNAMFNSYISNVLPELGEENMQQVTFQEYLNHRLGQDFEIENPYNQLEFILTAMDMPTYKARVAGIKFKSSIHFFEIIKSYRQSLEQSGMLFKDIVFKQKPIVTAEQITAQFYNSDTSLKFHNRLEKIKDWILDQVKEMEKREWSKSWVEDEIELLSNEEYYKAHAYLAKKHGFSRDSISDYNMEPKELAKLIVYQKLKPLRKRIRALHFIDMKGIYQQLFTDDLRIQKCLGGQLPTEWAVICQMTAVMLDENKLFYEDATPFLLMRELIQGFQTNLSIKHIFIDEAQDYSPFQFEFIKRLFPVARMTVLGDFNQAIFTHANEMVDFNILNNLYGQDEVEVINLARSYRSTKPIIEFTRRLIPNGEHIIPFERDGELPVVTEVFDDEELHRCIVSKVEELKRLGYQSIAIICKSAEESKRAHAALSSVDSIKLLKNGSPKYEQGVVIIPAYLAKGIEFEAVIIYNASTQIYGDESVRRLFYTACTRAMHYLQLYSVGEPSFLLASSRSSQ